MCSIIIMEAFHNSGRFYPPSGVLPTVHIQTSLQYQDCAYITPSTSSKPLSVKPSVAMLVSRASRSGRIGGASPGQAPCRRDAVLDALLRMSDVALEKMISPFTGSALAIFLVWRRRARSWSQSGNTLRTRYWINKQYSRSEAMPSSSHDEWLSTQSVIRLLAGHSPGSGLVSKFQPSRPLAGQRA